MKMTEDQIKEHKDNPNVVVEIHGKWFRCQCGCNVFNHPTFDNEIFECNSCKSIYISVTDDKSGTALSIKNK